MDVTFYSACQGGRPVRCSAETRRFAYDSLQGRYGQELQAWRAVDMDDTPGFAQMTAREKYDTMILKIAEEAPLRICEGELLCGSATLDMAREHVVPARYEGQAVQASISHLTPGFDKLLEAGLDSYEAHILDRMDRPADAEQQRMLSSLLNVCRAMRIWHGRYCRLLEERLCAAQTGEERRYWAALLENLRNVPFRKPRHFREALQALWFAFAFTRLCGNWPGIGRIDRMLGGYLEADLAAGLLTTDEARELLAHFFIKGCEWVTLGPSLWGSGDGQHYQNLVLAGTDEDGCPVVNEVTRLVLEVVEEFPIGDFPIAVRLTPAAPAWLPETMARVIRHGSGVVAVYNDALVTDSLVGFGYDRRQARRFANDGCWEVQIPGETHFAYTPLDGYDVFEREVLGLGRDDPPDYATFEELVTAYEQALAAYLEDWQAQADHFNEDDTPASVIALLVDDCIENARDYGRGGARYNVCAPHMGGLPDVGNALYAIKKLVFEEQRIAYPALIALLQSDWADAEPLRRYAANAYTYFGNGNEEVDTIVATLVDFYTAQVRRTGERDGILRPPGISTFGRQIEWSPRRHATPFGAKAHAVLSGNLNPTPGTDTKGATAIIRSHCAADLSQLTNGTALDIKLDPTAVAGADGIEAIIHLIQGFLALGGFFMQIDVVDNQVLLEAQKHPEQYSNLAVRISGWSARFVTLTKEWQQMIIDRTAQAH